MDLSEAQSNVVKDILPVEPVREDRRGRPWSDRRKTLNGILWILRTGAPWKDMPSRYGAYQTVHRRFQNWVQDGVLEKLLLAIAKDLQERGGLDLSECFIDGTFVPAKKGGTSSAKQSEARAARSWRLQTALVFLSPYAQPVLRQLK
jgi:transposase